jgi:hypothetical protein
MCFVALSTSSMAPGVIAACVFWIFLVQVTLRRQFTLERADGGRLIVALVVIALLGAHIVLVNYQTGGVDFQRFFVSCAVLLILGTAASLAARKFLETRPRDLLQGANLALGCLFLIGIGAGLGVPAIGPQVSGKPVIVFAEPSHFALAFLPVLLFRVSLAKRSTQVILVGCGLALAAALESATMVAGLLIISAVFLRRFALLLMLLMVAGGALAIDLTYYVSRLSFSTDSDNLSTLVLLQGWENAILGFRDTGGIGVGFQQFGIVGPIGDIAPRIAEILKGGSINLLDGGSTATKLIGELGIVGIFLVIGILYVTGRCALYIRRAQAISPEQRDVKLLFCCALVACYAFELLARGLGYFSPGGLLAAIGFLAILRLRHDAVRTSSAAGAARDQSAKRTSTSTSSLQPLANGSAGNAAIVGANLSRPS